MENETHVNHYSSAIRKWWVALILGIVFFAVGIMVFMRPAQSYVALAFAFGLMVLFSGIMEIYVGMNTPARSGKGWLISAGIIEMFLGILMLSMPAVMLVILPYILGFWLMFRGFAAIGIASEMLSHGMKGAGLTLFLAIMVVIGSFIIIAFPMIGRGAIVFWLGLSLLFAGGDMIALAFHLRSMRKDIIVAL